MKIALVALVVLVLGVVVAARIPKTAAYMEDVPLLGTVVEWIGHRGPSEVEISFDHEPTPAELTRAHDLLTAYLAPMPITVRGDRFVVTTSDAFRVYYLHLQHAPLRVFTVVYESPELEDLLRAMRRDEQAKKLGLSVELDRIGYHVQAPSDSLYVNPAWAEKHHCEGHHIEGTGTACYLSAKQRFDAYVHGDADLFVDAHPLALPPGRDFYATDDGPIYELESHPLEVPVSRLEVSKDALLIPLGAVPAASVEHLVEIEPGKLIAGELVGDRLAIPNDPELQLASLGLRVR